jgi:hypothetical protein
MSATMTAIVEISAICLVLLEFCSSQFSRVGELFLDGNFIQTEHHPVKVYGTLCCQSAGHATRGGISLLFFACCLFQ